MAGEVKCSRCHKVFTDDAATVGDVFGYKRPTVRYQQCKTCREGDVTVQYYQAHRERIRAVNNEYKDLHREEINQRRIEKIPCELCGRILSKCHMKRHQATRLCEKRRPPTEG